MTNPAYGGCWGRSPKRSTSRRSWIAHRNRLTQFSRSGLRPGCGSIANFRRRSPKAPSFRFDGNIGLARRSGAQGGMQWGNSPPLARPHARQQRLGLHQSSKRHQCKPRRHLAVAQALSRLANIRCMTKLLMRDESGAPGKSQHLRVGGSPRRVVPADARILVGQDARLQSSARASKR